VRWNIKLTLSDARIAVLINRLRRKIGAAGQGNSNKNPGRLLPHSKL